MSRFKFEFLGRIIVDNTEGTKYVVVNETQGTLGQNNGFFENQDQSPNRKSFEVVPLGEDPNNEKWMNKLMAISSESFDWGLFTMTDEVDPLVEKYVKQSKTLARGV